MAFQKMLFSILGDFFGGSGPPHKKIVVAPGKTHLDTKKLKLF